jgi:ribosomal protein S18 acetylase RimI-like enzyme
MARFEVKPTGADDRSWMAGMLRRWWGSTEMVSRGRLWNLLELPAFAAWRGGDPVGLVTYRFDGEECEITSLNSGFEGIGIGSALIDAVAGEARRRGCRRLWLITTNDNLHAIGFYQRRGFDIGALHRNALDESRKIKPEIPRVGLNGIPLLHEIEFELDPGGRRR